jgi:hypothetical protein
MTGEVGNGEYFVAQRRDEQQIQRGKRYAPSWAALRRKRSA